VLLVGKLLGELLRFLHITSNWVKKLLIYVKHLKVFTCFT